MKLKEINLFPIKSAGVIKKDSVNITPLGIDHDRELLLVDKKNRFISQRTHPSLTQLCLEWNTNYNLLSIEWRNSHRKFWIDVNQLFTNRPQISVKIWKDQSTALVAPEFCNQYLSWLLNDDVKLVKLVKRPLQKSKKISFETRFTDGYPILLTSEGSLKELNKLLPKKVPMDRFRSNLIVNCERPFLEESWEQVEINSVKLRKIQNCERCKVITIDQVTGQASKEPLKTLKKHHSIKSKPVFGIYMIAENSGRLSVGDSVKVK